jgi:hypothetical protein
MARRNSATFRLLMQVHQRQRSIEFRQVLDAIDGALPRPRF